MLDTLLAAGVARSRSEALAWCVRFVGQKETATTYGVNDKALQAMRVTLRDRLKVATTIGYGPRFLHSTGQLHKGGANHGVFIQLTADAVNDLPIEGQAYSFGTLIRAQALGDLKALSGRGYRVMRIHLGQNVVAGLKSTQAALDAALGVKKPAPRKPVTKATKKAAR